MFTTCLRDLEDFCQQLFYLTSCHMRITLGHPVSIQAQSASILSNPRETIETPTSSRTCTGSQGRLFTIFSWEASRPASCHRPNSRQTSASRFNCNYTRDLLQILSNFHILQSWPPNHDLKIAWQLPLGLRGRAARSDPRSKLRLRDC